MQLHWHPDVLALAEQWNRQPTPQKLFWFFSFELAYYFETYDDFQPSRDISHRSVQLCVDLAVEFAHGEMPPRELVEIDISLIEKFDDKVDLQKAWERVLNDGCWETDEITEMTSQWNRFLKIFGFWQLGLHEAHPNVYGWGDVLQILPYGGRLFTEYPAPFSTTSSSCEGNSTQSSELDGESEDGSEDMFEDGSDEVLEDEATKRKWAEKPDIDTTQKKITTWLYALSATDPAGQNDGPRMTIAERDALLKKLRIMEKQSLRNRIWAGMLETRLRVLEGRPGTPSDNSATARAMLRDLWEACYNDIPFPTRDRVVLQELYRDSSYFDVQLQKYKVLANRFEDYVGMLERRLWRLLPPHMLTDPGDWRLFVNLDGKGLDTGGDDEGLYEGSDVDAMDVDSIC